MEDIATPGGGEAGRLGVALVTGGAKRVGAEIARTLHGAGASVAITYRNSAAEAEALCASLEAQRRGSTLALQATLGDTGALPALVDAVVKRFGRLDVLVNNASSFYPTPLGEITDAAWTDLTESNLKAPIFLAQAAAGALRASRGVIVNMVDIHAKRPLKDHIVYCAAKAGLIMVTLALARELGPEVRVNGIAPGPIMWPEQGMTDQLKRQIVANTALKRAGSPRDVAGLVLYLVRDATYLTGQIIAVDGGRSVGW
jgi:pteridine reductase